MPVVGLGNTENVNVPTMVESLLTERALKCSGGGGFRCSHSMVLTNRGLYSFGSNKHGQLGHGNFEDKLVPTEIKV